MDVEKFQRISLSGIVAALQRKKLHAVSKATLADLHTKALSSLKGRDCDSLYHFGRTTINQEKTPAQSFYELSGSLFVKHVFPKTSPIWYDCFACFWTFFEATHA